MAESEESSLFEGNPLESDAPEVWERLVRAVGPASILVCLRERMSPSAKAKWTPEDVWQETLLQVWRDRGACEWRGVRDFRRWVLRVAENRIRDLVEGDRAVKRGGGRVGRSLDPHASATPSVPPPVASTTPSRVASFAEEADRMRLALERIDDDVREVVRLRLFEELPIEEVARRLDLGTSAVKHRFRKGAAAYERELRALATQEPDA